MKINKKVIYSWVMYDWANSAFATTMMAAVLPVYFSSVAANQLQPNIASSYWGYGNTIAMLLNALLAPVLGAISDYTANKKKFLLFFLLLGVLTTGMIFFTSAGMWFAVLFLYVLGRLGFAGSNLFYDSFLPHISTEKNIDYISSLGYAFGYIGGGILLAVNLTMILQYDLWGIAGSAEASRISFLSVSVWWFVFSLPLLMNVKEPHIKKSLKIRLNAVKAGFLRLNSTLREIQQYKQTFLFLIAFWFYNDGIGTIIVMAVIFGNEVGIGQEHLIGAILTVQFIGIPFTLLFAKISAKISAKNSIYIGLSVYSLIAVGGYFLQNALHFWILAVLVAMVQGGTQALSRSVFASMTPRNRSAEFFGFFDVSQKFSGILGPAIFGLLSQILGSSRFSVVALIIFFIGGILILRKVDIKEGILAARKAERLID